MTFHMNASISHWSANVNPKQAKKKLLFVPLIFSIWVGLTSNKAIRAFRISWPCLEARWPRIPTTDAILGTFNLLVLGPLSLSCPLSLQKSFRPQFKTRVMMVRGKQDLEKHKIGLFTLKGIFNIYDKQLEEALLLYKLYFKSLTCET